MNLRPSTTRLLAVTALVALALPSFGAPAAGAELASASDLSFHSRVLNSSVPVLVEFWAPYCVPCRHLEKSLETVAAELGPRARIIRVNIERNTVYARRYGITSLPTTMIFNHGQVVEKVSGPLSPEEIRDLLNVPAPASTVVASLAER